MKHSIHKNCNSVKEGCTHYIQGKKTPQDCNFFFKQDQQFIYLIRERGITHWQENLFPLSLQQRDSGSTDRASQTKPTMQILIVMKIRNVKIYTVFTSSS